MKVLRIALLMALGLFALIIYGLVTTLIEYIQKPTSHEMSGYGIFLWYAGWGFVLSLPLCIGLGELWLKGVKKYIPHVLLLIALSLWSINMWSIHPIRTLLFLACGSLTLPLRWLIDRTIMPKSVG